MPAWILLRGLSRESGHWGAFAEHLRAAWPDARVIAPDLPGNGALYRLRSPASVAAMTEACRAQLQAQGVPPPYRLLALSLGGMVAADWAARHPQELAGGVLVNTSLRGVAPWYWRMRPANAPSLLRLLLVRKEPRRQEEIVLRLTSRLHPAGDPVVEGWVDLRRRHPVSAVNTLRQLWAAWRFRAPRQRPAVPLLVLASARDGLVDVRCSRRLASRWQLALAEHPRAGHDLPLDDADWVLAQIQHWLSTPPPA